MSNPLIHINEVVNDFALFRGGIVSNRIENMESVLGGHVEYRDELIEKIISKNLSLLKEFQNISAVAREQNRLSSCDLNFFRLFHIGEIGHSYLLAKFLNPYAEHGQGRLFLNIFLKMLGITDPEKGQWIVTAEKGRIDVLLKRRDPHSVIVIENKSNDAGDRPNQLYRYWYQELFSPNSHQSYDYAAKNPDHFCMLYLPSGDWKNPSDNSLHKPTGWDTELPEKMPIEPILWSFDNQIVEWLEECKNQLPKNNFRMNDYVSQYIELWRR